MNQDRIPSDLDIAAMSSLAEPVRRSLYELVIASPRPLGRDEAAEEVGVSRQVAAYHLDRLAEDGLLEIEFRRLSGRSGPGAGRPAKLYRRSDRSFQVTVPPRRYELAARILLEAVSSSEAGSRVLIESARRIGTELGRDGLGPALVGTGYQPVEESGETRFRNCPFHVLRDQDRDTTCSLNLALVEGMVQASGSKVEAVLAPEDGYCCVRLLRGGG